MNCFFLLFSYVFSAPNFVENVLQPFGNISFDLKDESLIFINSFNMNNENVQIVFNSDNISYSKDSHFMFQDGEIFFLSLIDKPINFSVWMIPNGMCNQNSYLVESNYKTNILSVDGSLTSDYCFFSSMKSSNIVVSVNGHSKFNEFFHIYTTASHYENSIKENERYSFQNPLIISGKLNEFSITIESNDNDCGFTPILDFKNQETKENRTLINLKCEVAPYTYSISMLVFPIIIILIVAIIIIKSKRFINKASTGFASIPKPSENSDDNLDIEVVDLISDQKEESIL